MRLHNAEMVDHLVFYINLVWITRAYKTRINNLIKSLRVKNGNIK